MSSNTQTAYAYPTTEQYGRWKDRAEELDMSVSEFIQHMVEAGIKVDRGFELTMERDETNRELREQRNDLKDELGHARQRIEDLEERLHRSERQTVLRYVEEHPGAGFDEIVRHVIDTVPERVNDHLEAMEGDAVRRIEDDWYPADHPENDEK